MSKPGKFFNRSSKTTTTLSATTPGNANTIASSSQKSAVVNAPSVKPGAKAELKPNQGNLSRQAVAEAAYYLWLERGGNETVNWLEAEAMLARQHAASR